MSPDPRLDVLLSEMEAELRQRILPFWMERATDRRTGGFFGLIDADGRPQPDAPRGSILNARILWTFSAAARVLGDDGCLAHADRAVEDFRARFLDAENGGVFWMVEADGAPRDNRKHVYAQAFAIYALAEHFRAAADPLSLGQAIELFRCLDRHAHLADRGGYHEAFSREWTPLADVRLSDEDDDTPRSMNTHLHVLEAYTNLLRVWPDAVLRLRLRELVELFLDTIIDTAQGQVRCFFDADWTPLSDTVSYGHDIETSWLLMEAADVLGDAELRGRVRDASLRIASAVMLNGLDNDGGIFNEGGPSGVTDTDKEWWPQAEAIVGFLNAYQETGRDAFLDAAWSTWVFTRTHVVDRVHGEWHRRVSREGGVRPGHEKAGPWKCPYHNARACLEVITRTDSGRLAVLATDAGE